MRTDEEIEGGISIIENRIERDAESEHAVKPLVLSIWQAKRAGLLLIRDSENGEYWQVRDELEYDLLKDINLLEYTQLQAMKNAMDWAEGDTDSL
ncbi:hypothetical protein [Natrinema sp. DC36]|uniref:hypothetical protein n=1 Tax=Natrinema sp. DC36 TaxID=2878680 RepID=UPI001CF04238|nr:hypothetical protein [Natrinema sp. DC36]